MWCGKPSKEQGPQREKVSLDDVIVFAEQSGIGVECEFESGQLASEIRPSALGLGEDLVTAVDELFLPVVNLYNVESYGSG